MLTLKEVLFQQCEDFVDTRFQTIQTIISSHQKALSSETKSSAGDKHETGRAMLQLEMEKAGQQLAAAQQMQQTLAKINILISSTNIALGSVIKTTSAYYFLSISAGMLKDKQTVYFAISPSSPIGKLLVGKKAEDTFIWRGEEITIESVL
ncbi:3-oxoacyl-ACP synthase [Flavobacteriaceae bacterium]|nr:3-oxoacyl-ACP synthase [Flavobacteriaceae bacterium]